MCLNSIPVYLYYTDLISVKMKKIIQRKIVNIFLHLLWMLKTVLLSTCNTCFG